MKRMRTSKSIALRFHSSTILEYLALLLDLVGLFNLSTELIVSVCVICLLITVFKSI